MSRAHPKSNVVAGATSFVGRSDDLTALDGELRRGRLVTIVGPPGAGKTRLAIEYVLRHGGAFSVEAAGGAWFCDLSQAVRADDVIGKLADVLGVSLADRRESADPIAQLGSILTLRGSTLLVLDNFEQLVAVAGGLVAQWLSRAPELSVIVTSRSRLGIVGESCLELGGLELPEASGDDSNTDAVRLFIERARSVRNNFEPDRQEREQIVELVRRLDGLPYAIELAGARMGVLGPKQLLERLGESLDVLRSGSASTLRVTLDWSWNLLSPIERDVLAQISVFRGAFSLEAAEAVIDVSQHQPAAEVVDLLEALRNSSLLQSAAAAELPGELGFSLLEIVRVYAEEKLEQSGPAEAARERHARYFERVGTSWALEVDRSRGPEFLRRLALAMPNLLAVHRRALARTAPSPSDLGLALSSVLALEPVYYMRGPTAPCLALLDEIFAHDSTGVDPRLVMLGLKARARALRDLGKTDESLEVLERALDLARQHTHPATEARLLGHVGYAHQVRGQLDEALRAFEAASKLSAQAGDLRTEGMLLASVGWALAALGRLDDAAAAYDRALEIDEQVGNSYAAAAALANRAELFRARGRAEAARADLERALEVYARFGERRHEGIALSDLGVLHQEQAELDQARQCFERALIRHREFGGRAFSCRALLALAGLDREQRQPAEARRRSEQAVRLARNLADRELLMRALLSLAASQAELGRIAAAEEAFDEATALTPSVADPSLARLVELERGELDLARAAAARRSGDRKAEAEHLERARARALVGEGAPLLELRTPAERLALRALRRGLAREAPVTRVDSTPTSLDHPAPVGRYELLVQIASGGMASVFVGRQRGAGGFERLVAIKRLHAQLAAEPKFARAFLEEARLAALIRHPNVVSVQDVHQYGTEHLLVMDYVDGASLAELMSAAARSGRTLELPIALYVLVQALRGLHAAHEQLSFDGTPLGIVHRDASPHNVLIGADGSVRITDFGIAKARTETVVTEPGLAKGKFRYMAPEQARADPLDRRADIFSIGVIAWELCAGRRLYGDANDIEVLSRLLEPDFCAPPLSAPNDLRRSIERALAADRRARPRDALELAEQLDQIAADMSKPAREPDLSRVVEELCGASLAERRRAISEALSTSRGDTPSLAPRPSTPPAIELPRRVLRAGASGRWFVPPGGARVGLERRRALRRILKLLVDRRLSAPGSALDLEALLEAGWPGERVRHDAGTLRVYNALSTLRKLGLREILLSRDDGYLLDPKLAVEREDEPGDD